MFNFTDPKEEKLAKKFLKSVWKASYLLSLKRPGTTIHEIIELLKVWIEILETEGIKKPK